MAPYQSAPTKNQRASEQEAGTICDCRGQQALPARPVNDATSSYTGDQKGDDPQIRRFEDALEVLGGPRHVGILYGIGNGSIGFCRLNAMASVPLSGVVTGR